MKCSECVASGQTSRIHERAKRAVGGAVEKYYDEAGEFHNHDASVLITPFDCTNGHTWEHVGRTPCPTCGKPVSP